MPICTHTCSIFSLCVYLFIFWKNKNNMEASPLFLNLGWDDREEGLTCWAMAIFNRSWKKKSVGEPPPLTQRNRASFNSSDQLRWSVKIEALNELVHENDETAPCLHQTPMEGRWTATHPHFSFQTTRGNTYTYIYQWIRCMCACSRCV
jgi:hypothetical protein